MNVTQLLVKGRKEKIKYKTLPFAFSSVVIGDTSIVETVPEQSNLQISVAVVGFASSLLGECSEHVVRDIWHIVLLLFMVFYILFFLIFLLFASDPLKSTRIRN